MDLGNQRQFKIAPDEAILPSAKGCNPLRKTKDAAEILEFALECAGAGVWELDLVTKTARLCPQSLRMLGLPDSHSGELLLEDMLKLINSRDTAQFQPPPISLFAPFLHEFPVVRPDGEVR